eukprot:1098457_1
MDILSVGCRTVGMFEEQCEIKGATYHVFDFGKQESQRKKWIHCFEKVNMIIFQASMTHLISRLGRFDDQNAMIDNIELWEEIVNNEWFKDRTYFFLTFTHWDMYEEMTISEIANAPIFENYDGQQTKDCYFEYLTELYLDKVTP